jgi:hypothetical protein
VTGGSCEVLTLTFRCSVTLQPGRTAAVTIRVLPDALKAPARIVQQIAVSTDGSRSNAMTSVVRLDGGKSSDTERLAGQISDFPGSMVVTLAMLLFAIAATATRRRQGIRQERNR